MQAYGVNKPRIVCLQDSSSLTQPSSTMAQLVDASLLVALLLLSFPVFFLRRRRTIASKEQQPPLPPSPRGIPILGNLHQLGTLPHRSLRILADKHGPLMLLHLGQVPTLIVSSAAIASEITKNHDLIFSSRPPFKVAQTVFYGTTDLAFAPYGEYWRNARKVCVSHLLSPKMVQSFRRIREEEVALLIDNISSQASSVINMSEVLMTFTNDFLCRVVSRRLSGDPGKKKIIRGLVQEISDLIGTFHVGDYIPYLGWLDVLIGLSARDKRNSKGWDDVLEDVMANNIREEDGIEDFADVLLSLKKEPATNFQLTRDNIKALLTNMLAAGTDPSYILLEWAMTELLRKREVMKKLQDEVRGKVSRKTMILEEDLSQMSYLKGVLKEVLCLHPPTPLLVPRESMEDCQIQGCQVPKRTRVIVNAWAIGRDPKFWESPEEFRPERFLDSATDYKGNDFHFIPFGVGRRICPGMNFSMAVTELALANLVYQFDWELCDGTTIENMDMTEAPGLAARKSEKLELIAKPYTYKKL